MEFKTETGSLLGWSGLLSLSANYMGLGACEGGSWGPVPTGSNTQCMGSAGLGQGGSCLDARLAVPRHAGQTVCWGPLTYL